MLGVKGFDKKSLLGKPFYWEYYLLNLDRFFKCFPQKIVQFFKLLSRSGE